MGPNSSGRAAADQEKAHASARGKGLDCDFLIVGSGFGGSVSACRLAQKGYSVAVMEMGRRWTEKDFPRTNWNVRRWLWRPGLRLFGFFNLRPFRHVMIICGNAVGGGSITYANTLLVPPDEVWDEGTWAGIADWKREMPAHFASAERMLGVTENRILGPADRMLQQVAEMAGVGHSFAPTRVATFFAADGEPAGARHPDPYFGGEGPARGTCTGCGGCMMGCRHDAKNTLDKNYLYLAERRGARVYEQTRVLDVRPRNGKPDGAEGYEVTTASTTRCFGKRRRVWRARNVVFSGSSLGTQELLFRLKESGSLPNVSDALGRHVRTNAESIVGVRFLKENADMSGGVAIGSSISLDARTRIEATRYPRGSDAMGLLTTMMVGGAPGLPRILGWLWHALAQPRVFWRLMNPLGFARQTVILLVMQTVDISLRMRLKRPWYWPFAKVLCTEGPRIPPCIPQANAFAEAMARRFGGHAVTSISEILFNIPFTAHCIGGCAMAASPDQGVVDAHHRVFGYRNLYVVDGSTLSANLGVNPSLAIAALAERAMAFIPAREAQEA